MTAPLFAPTTELEAVNRILASIGQSPVNALSASGVPDVTDAIAMLRETVRDLESAGWSWNTDRNYTLSPQTSGFIKVPTGVLEVDAEDASATIVVRREPTSGELCLYDADNHTFVFTEDVDVAIVWGFPFDDIPQAARTYATISAARKFQAQKVSSPTLDNYNDGDEQRAWNLLMRTERRTRDTNSFRGNAGAQRALRRRF